LQTTDKKPCTGDSQLFSPLTIRGVTLRNRIAVSPMCQHSSIDGMATDWHLVHLGSRAVGGAALVMVEATAVEADGRISPDDMGIWQDKHIGPLARIATFIKEQGAVAAIQLAHAGRKASMASPWKGALPVAAEKGGWQSVGPSAIAFDDGWAVPKELSEKEIEDIVLSFRQATARAIKAGFQVIEIHSAHGYLLHSFLSPISNKRSDKYGGSLENRMRFLLEVVDAVRKEMPEDKPLFVRISSTDWINGAWDERQSILLSKQLQAMELIWLIVHQAELRHI
jgi:2,4-dienoyl-CoA reductase (NADPH2)